MKPSRYNHFFCVNDRAILGYNSFTAALVLFSPEEYAHFQQFCDDPSDSFFESVGLDQFKQQLVQMGMIVADEVDEVERLHTLCLALKREEHCLGLTIIPTLSCNFRCSYCFSYARKDKMGTEVQQALLRFADQKLDEANSLSVTWYGGEPTLCLDLIEKLSAGFTALCRRRGAEFLPQDIVTNGYLLTRRSAERLRSAGFATAQVTLDGDRATHDCRRPLRSGCGTFDRILDNLVAAGDILKVQVRINIDRNNAETALGTLDALADRGLQKVAVYFGHVEPFTEVCADVAGACLTTQEFSELSLSLTKQALAHGFSAFSYPRLQLGGVCGANKRLAYVVAPDGLLFKCWAEASLGARWSVGSLLALEPSPLQSENQRRFLEWEPLADRQCRECAVLPICMGGCSHMRIHNPGRLDCATWRYILPETLALRYILGSKEPAVANQGNPVS